MNKFLVLLIMLATIVNAGFAQKKSDKKKSSKSHVQKHGKITGGTAVGGNPNANVRFGDASNGCTNRGICSAKPGGTKMAGEYEVSLTGGDLANMPNTTLTMQLDQPALTEMKQADPALYTELTTRPTYKPSAPSSFYEINDFQLVSDVWRGSAILKSAKILFSKEFGLEQVRTTPGGPVVAVRINIPQVQLTTLTEVPLEGPK